MLHRLNGKTLVMSSLFCLESNTKSNRECFEIDILLMNNINCLTRIKQITFHLWWYLDTGMGEGKHIQWCWCWQMEIYHTNVWRSIIDSKCSVDMSEAKESLEKSSSTISSAAEDPELEDGEEISVYEQSKYPDSSPELWQGTFTAWVVYGWSEIMYSPSRRSVAGILVLFGDDVMRGDACVDDIQCWASIISCPNNSAGRGWNSGEGSVISTGLPWTGNNGSFLDVCPRIDDRVCMWSIALLMMPSLPAFLSPEPIRGRWRFSLSRASLIRFCRRRSRAFLLRADSSERIWCGTYFLRRLGFCTPFVPAMAWGAFIDDAELYTILVTYGCGRDVYRRRGQDGMCWVPLSRLIYTDPQNGLSIILPLIKKSKRAKPVYIAVIESSYCSLLNTRCAAHALISLATVQGVTTSTPQWGQRGEYCDSSWNKDCFIRKIDAALTNFIYLHTNCMQYFYEPELISVVPDLNTSL